MTIVLTTPLPTSTLETVGHIITNLEGIMSGLGLNLEDASDGGIRTAPMGAIEYSGDDFDDNSQQAPVYNTSNFLLMVRVKRVDPTTDRDNQVFWIHTLKEALTVNKLNIGGLVDSKPVTRINHDGANTSLEGEIVKIDYDIGVKYRVT